MPTCLPDLLDQLPPDSPVDIVGDDGAMAQCGHRRCCNEQQTPM